jgi:hypothetical protein
MTEIHFQTELIVKKRKYSIKRKPPVIEFDKLHNQYVEIATGNRFSMDKGTRMQVLDGIAYRTKGLLTKADLIIEDKSGKILSRRKHESGKQQSNLTETNKQKTERKEQRILAMARAIEKYQNMNTKDQVIDNK